MPYRACYYHVVWATKHRLPLITPDIERTVISTLTQKSIALKSHIYAANCTEDHVHVAVSISVNISVSDWIGQIKGRITREVNATYPDLVSRFSWQDGYGVLTFGAKHLDYVVNYIARQKEHHRDDTIQARLERMND